ncbi:MAG: hypothetical protein IH784_06850, partial [Bacteroidetes bacterium]|nr:hypothetical protein [Bacteroidota bacterium]
RLKRRSINPSANRNIEERREGGANGFILKGGIAKPQFRQDKRDKQDH